MDTACVCLEHVDHWRLMWMCENARPHIVRFQCKNHTWWRWRRCSLYGESPWQPLRAEPHATPHYYSFNSFSFSYCFSRRRRLFSSRWNYYYYCAWAMKHGCWRLSPTAVYRSTRKIIYSVRIFDYFCVFSNVIFIETCMRCATGGTRSNEFSLDVVHCKQRGTSHAFLNAVSWFFFHLLGGMLNRAYDDHTKEKNNEIVAHSKTTSRRNDWTHIYLFNDLRIFCVSLPAERIPSCGNELPH